MKVWKVWRFSIQTFNSIIGPIIVLKARRSIPNVLNFHNNWTFKTIPPGPPFWYLFGSFLGSISVFISGSFLAPFRAPFWDPLWSTFCIKTQVKQSVSGVSAGSERDSFRGTFRHPFRVPFWWSFWFVLGAISWQSLWAWPPPASTWNWGLNFHNN